MTEILEVSKKHFIDYKRNYLIIVIISLIVIGLIYLSFREYSNDIIYTAFYTIIAIPIFGIIIVNKSTNLYKAVDITHKRLRIIAMIIFPPIPVALITITYFQVRMIGRNIDNNEALFYGLFSSLTGFLALLVLVFIFLELKRWTPNWPVFFGKFAMLTLYFLVIFVYPVHFYRLYVPAPYHSEITIVMIVLFITHITTYIIMAYSRMEY